MEYAEEEKGRCRSCGFLSKHPIEQYAGLPTPRFYEAEPHERTAKEYSRLFSHRPDMAARGVVQTEIACFVHKADLMENIRDFPFNTLEGQQARLPMALEVIGVDRHCPAWYPYNPGFSPREHYEQLEMQRLEDDRRAFEMKLFELGQKAQENSLRVAEDSKRIVHDLKEIARSNDDFVRSSERSTRRVTILVIVLAVAQTIGALLALPSVLWVQRLWHYLFG